MATYIKTKSLAHILLGIVAIGGVTLVALMAPNAFQIFGRRQRNAWYGQRVAERRRIREILQRLRRRRLIEYEERGKETFLNVTEEGRHYIRKFDFNDLTLPKSKRWDGKWRIVLFDIPETKGKRRRIFQDKLRQLGFHQLQKSAWVYPFGCRDEVSFMTSFLEIAPSVLYLETNSADLQEGQLRKVFGLL